VGGTQITAACKLYNEEIQNIYSSQNIVMVIKPRKMKFTGHKHAWESLKFIKNFS
jgi:hypothetical protein